MFIDARVCRAIASASVTCPVWLLCQKTRDRHHGGHRLRQALCELLRVSVCVFDRVTLPQCAFAETVCAGEHTEGVEWGEPELAQEFDLVGSRGAVEEEHGTVCVDGCGAGLGEPVDQGRPGAVFVLHGQCREPGSIDEGQIRQ
ncbi:hypothetical protein ACQGFJ_01595 [Rhodococcus sp. 3.70]